MPCGVKGLTRVLLLRYEDTEYHRIYKTFMENPAKVLKGG